MAISLHHRNPVDHLFLSVVALLCFFTCTSMGLMTYKVGGHNGWDGEPIDFEYQFWSLSKNFYVGDTIRFEYDAGIDNVVQVRAENFVLCDPLTPFAVYASGNDSITFGEEGCFYYISGHRPHCLNGQKVALFVQNKGVQRRDPASPSSCYPLTIWRFYTHADDSFKQCWAILLFLTLTIAGIYLFGVFMVLIKKCIKEIKIRLPELKYAPALLNQKNRNLDYPKRKKE